MRISQPDIMNAELEKNQNTSSVTVVHYTLNCPPRSGAYISTISTNRRRCKKYLVSQATTDPAVW